MPPRGLPLHPDSLATTFVTRLDDIATELVGAHVIDALVPTEREGAPRTTTLALDLVFATTRENTHHLTAQFLTHAVEALGFSDQLVVHDVTPDQLDTGEFIVCVRLLLLNGAEFVDPTPDSPPRLVRHAGHAAL